MDCRREEKNAQNTAHPYYNLSDLWGIIQGMECIWNWCTTGTKWYQFSGAILRAIPLCNNFFSICWEPFSTGDTGFCRIRWIGLQVLVLNFYIISWRSLQALFNWKLSIRMSFLFCSPMFIYFTLIISFALNYNTLGCLRKISKNNNYFYDRWLYQSRCVVWIFARQQKVHEKQYNLSPCCSI